MADPTGNEPRDGADGDGVGRAVVDTDAGRIVFDPDGNGSVERTARELSELKAGPPAHCTIEFDPSGARSSESGSLALERHLERQPGVVDATASFRTGQVRVTYDGGVTSATEIESVVRRRGLDRTGRPEAADDGPTATETEAGLDADRAKLRREAAFVGITLLGMVTGLLGSWFDAPATVVWAGYGAAYVFGGWYGLLGSIDVLRQRAVDIDLLMILAALGALAIGAPFEGAMLLFLFSLSNTLQHYATGRSRRAIRSLLQMRPESAEVLRDGEEVTVPIDDVAIDDTIVVRPGDRIPLDGVVESGESTVDQASLTGESVPVPKAPGDEVFGGTITENGSLEIRVTRQAHESAIARLIHMVEEAHSERAPTQRLIDRLEQPYVLAVLGMTVAAIAVPLALGADQGPTIYRAMTLMVAASPCAVVISTPAAVLSAITAGARQGVLFKGGEHVESVATVDAVAFDKTGTLTEGDTSLTDVEVASGATLDDAGLTEDRLLAICAAVQKRSEHHLAEATVEAAEERHLEVPDASGFQATVGKGVSATVDGRTIHIGNPRYYETLDGSDPEGLEAGLEALATLQQDGKTSVLVTAEDGDERVVLGWLAFSDEIREGAAEMIQDLRNLGVEEIVVLTGDNQAVADRVAEQLGIDTVGAELLPEQKVERVSQLVAEHDTVAMVGDGVNDAPALATADVGVAMGGAGTDVALETADVVLMSDDVSKLPYALGLGRRTQRTLYVNFAIAFGAIAVMIVAILTQGIPLPLAVVGHEGSTVLVSLNGLRLLGFRG
ncbi:hypothetical protein GCM10028857_08330 [Salinarchaeum chitinilyticum]